MKSEIPLSLLKISKLKRSRLLSHIAKRQMPDYRVIYNDYNGFSYRLANVDHTNALLSEIKAMLSDIPKEAIFGRRDGATSTFCTHSHKATTPT